MSQLCVILLMRDSRYNTAVRTDTATKQPTVWPSTSDASTGPLIHFWDRRLALLLALALLAGSLAYQAPAATDIAIGWFGDRLFLRASEGAGVADQTSLYGDEFSPDAQTMRSRWTRQDATFWLPGLGAGGDLELTLRAQGWPSDVQNHITRQPHVTVAVNSTTIGSFEPTDQWGEYTFRIPGDLRANNPLVLSLHTSDSFTNTLQYQDARPKGIRLEQLRIADLSTRPTLPAALPLALLVLGGGIWMLALSAMTRRPTLAFVLSTLLVSATAIGLAFARIWTAALMPWFVGAALFALVIALRAPIRRYIGALLGRYSQGAALNYGLISMGTAWLAYVIMRAGLTFQPPGSNLFRSTFPDSLLLSLLGAGLLLLALVLGREGLPRLANGLVRMIGSRTGALTLLGLFLVIWVAYLARVNAMLPYVGHADYADNAVVARNLVAGRGWVVDYVTQFYRLYDGVTRPQETWPMLQPVWIAPFFAVLGEAPWVAKLPNLIFITLLGVLIYTVGTRLWDRRVGLTATIIILTSHLFFKLIIYTTTDLAFVVFLFGAMAFLYRAVSDQRNDRNPRNWLIGSAVLTGLMMLQKPGSGVMMAFGMGVWFLIQMWHAWRARVPGEAQISRKPVLPLLHSRSAFVNAFAPVVLWSAIALAILSPYVVRNLVMFGTPFFSTESRDAWVQGYTRSWEIYKIYTPEQGLGETGGLPDATWILRWGFDRSLKKVSDQVVAVRDYMLPAWKGLPFGLSEHVFGRSDKSPVLFGVGAWLVLGALGTLRSRLRLLSLLMLTFLPYTAFLIFYWHADEERYFVMVMPWLALLASYALWRGYDRIAAIGDGRWAPLGLLLAGAALVMIVGPSWPVISEKVRAEPQRYAADIDAYTWLADWTRQHNETDAVVMTRNPWQFNWQTRLPALMVPHTTNRDTFLRIAKHYQVRYLVVDSLQRPPAEIRATMDALIKDGTLEHVYTTPVYQALNTEGRTITMTTEIYRFPANYGGVVAAQQ
jgi:hypothetical protein